MTFTELLTEVYNITARPDLDELTKTAVKSATLKAHQSDFFSKDIHEQSYQFVDGIGDPDPDYHHSLDYISIVPNYRALKYMRRYDTSTGAAVDFFTVITPEEILDRYANEKTNVCYVAGRVIEIKSYVEFDTILLGCYVNPTVVEASYSSWVADLYPYAIVHEAARLVFATISQTTEANAQKELTAEKYAELKINNVSDVGY